MLAASAPALACRLTAIITGLCATIALRAAKDAALRPLLVQLWGALRRRAGRFEKLAAKIQAGQLTAPRAAPRPRKPRPKRPPAATPPFPGGFAWLVRRARETSVYGSQLQALLSDPDIAPLLEAAPQAGRLLRPLCRMLGVRPGPALAPALVLPRRQRPQRPPRTKPTQPPDLRPRPSRPWQMGSFRLGPRRDTIAPLRNPPASPAPTPDRQDPAAPCAPVPRPP